MTVVVLAVILCVVNLLLWIVLFIRFNSLFSADDIVKNTKEEMNKLVADINRNVDRNITLIDDRIKELKLLMAQADKKVAFVQSELSKSSDAVYFTNALKSISNRKNDNVNNPYRRSASININELSESLDRDAVHLDIINDDIANKNIPNKKSTDKNLNNNLNVSNSENHEIHNIPSISVAENPIEAGISRKDFSTEVLKLYRKGYNVEAIASELSCSISEVSLVLDFFK
ncbi:MAG: hypothetical protein K6F69_07545 [Treponema sp.]|nr:hypothetical protein [Treponema sp.]